MTTIRNRLSLLLILAGAASIAGCSLQDFDKFEEPVLPDGSDGMVYITTNISGTGGGSIRADIPDGYGCADVCGTYYPWGTTIVYTASPNAGARFVGWQDPCSGTGECVVRATGSIWVTAEFELIAP